MRGYTSLEQSKKLAEILPLESADMYWWSSGKRYYIEAIDDDDFVENRDIRAWSLAALLQVLPNEISTGEEWYNKYQIDIRKYNGVDNTTWYQIAYGNNRGSSGSWHDIISTSEQEKFVDVCYEMIIKLHEQNLL